MAIERVTVLDLEEAARLPADPDTAVVSVTDPGVQAPLADGFARVLRLAFHDVDDDMLDTPGGGGPLAGSGVRPFSEQQARRLVGWTDALAGAAGRFRLAVHCHAGISRSSAIAWFLHQRHGADLRWSPGFSPNRRVLRLLAEVAGQRVADPGG